MISKLNLFDPVEREAMEAQAKERLAKLVAHWPHVVDANDFDLWRARVASGRGFFMRDDVKEWLAENCGSAWAKEDTTFGFANERDLLHFKLRFG